MTAQHNTANDHEWANGANWHWLNTVYFARADSRVIVPKRQGPKGSRTLNFARGESWFILALLLAPTILIFTVIVPLLQRTG